MPLEINSDGLLDSINKLTAGLDRFEKQLADSGKQVNTFDRLFGSTKNFDAFITSIKRLGATSTDSFKVIADGIAGIANALSKLKGGEADTAVSVFEKLPKAFANLDTLSKNTGLVRAINAIAGITRALIKLAAIEDLTQARINIKAVGEIVGELAEKLAQMDTLKSINATGIRSGINAISALINGLARLSEVDVASIKIPPELVDSIQKLMNVIQGLPSGGAEKKVGVFKQVFQGIVTSFSQPVKSAGAISAQQTAQTFGTIAKALASFSNVSLDAKQTNNIIKTFGKLSVAFQGIGLLLKLMPGGHEISEFSKTIQRLGIGLSGLARAAAILDIAAIRKLITALGLLGVATKLLSKVLNFKNDKSAEAFAKVIGSVATAMNAVASLNNIQIKANTKLDSVIAPIIKIVGAFRKLKGVKVEGLGDVVKGIGDIIKSVAGPELNTENLEKLPNVIERIVDSLRRLNGIRASGASGGTGFKASDLTASVRAGLLQVKVIEQITVAFRGLIRTVNTFADQGLAVLRNVGRQAEQFSRNLIQQARNIANTISLQGLASSDAFNIASGFEETSSLLSAAGLNEDELQLAQEFADVIGIQYPLSANQALDAILNLTRAGRDLAEVELILPAASDLAALAGGDLEGVTQTLIGIAGAFSQLDQDTAGGFENIEQAANLLSAAADVGTASVASLSQGLANVGPSANAAGLDLESTLAILSQFEDANIRGAEAGTQLRSVLNSLNSNRARDELRRLGVATENSDGTIRELNDVIVDINNAYETLGLTEAERARSISLLGDSYARQGLNVLLLNDGYSATVDEMQGLDTASEKARKAMDNLRGDTEQLRGSMETLLKDVLYPLIRRAFRPLIQLATTLTNALLGLPEPVKDIISVMIQIGATLGTLVAAGLAFSGVLGIIGGGFVQLISIIGSLILHFPAVLAGFAAVGGSLIVLVPLIAAVSVAFVSLSTVVSNIYRAIENNVGGAGLALTKFIVKVTDLRTQVQESFSDVASAVNAVFGGLFGSRTSTLGRRITLIFLDLGERVDEFREALEKVSRSDIISFLQRIQPYIGGLINSFQNLGDGIFVFLTGGFDEGIAKIQRSIADIASIVTDFAQKITGLNLGTIITRFNEGDIRGGINEMFQSLVRLFQNAVRENIPALRQGAEFLLSFLNPFSRAGSILSLFGFDEIGGALQTFGSEINRVLGGIFEVIARLFSGERIQDIIGGSFGGALTGLFASIQRLVAPIISLFERFFGIFQGRSAQFGEIFEEQVGFLEQSIRNVTRFVNTLAFGLEQALGPVIQNLPQIVAGIEAFAGRVIGAFAPLRPFIEGVLGSVGRIFETLSRVILTSGNFGEVAELVVSELLDTLADLPGTVGRILSNLGGIFQSSLLSGLGDSLQKGDILGGVLRFLGEVVETAWREIPNLFRFLGEALGQNFLIAIGDALDARNIIRVAIIILEKITTTIYWLFDQIGLVINGALTELSDRALAGGDPLTAAFLRIFGGIARLVASAIAALQNDAFEFAQFFLRIVDLIGPVGTAIIALGGAFLVFRTQIIAFATNFIKQMGGMDFALARFQGLLRGFLQQAVRYAGIVAVFISLSAAFNRIGNVLEGKENVFSGFLNFLVDIGAEALSLLGLDGVFASLVDQLGNIFGVDIPNNFDQIIANVRTTVDQLSTLFQIFVDNLGRDFQHGIDLIVVSAADAIQRIKVAAGQGDASSDQFFAIGDTLANQATLSAEQFFGTLGDAIANPQNMITLSAQLRSSASTILSEFTDFFAEGGSVAQLAAQGLLGDVVASLAASGNLDDAFSQLRGNLRDTFDLFAALTPEQQGENFSVFFNSVKSGAEQSGPALLSILQLMDQLVASGDLTREQADAFRSQLVPATEGAMDVLTEYNTVAAQNTAEIEAMNTAADNFGYTLDGLQETFLDTTLSASQLGDRFRDVVSGLTAEEIDLAQLFDLFSQLSPEEAAESFGEFFDAAIRGGVALAGNEELFAQLQTQIDDLRNSGLITNEQRRTFLDQMAREAEAASNALDTTIRTVDDLKAKLRDLANGTIKGVDIFGPVIPKGGADQPIIPPFDPNASGVDDYITDQEAEIAERISDFAYEESKRIKDDIADEKAAAKEIEELKQETLEEELDQQAKFQLEEKRRLEDHQIAIRKINEDAAATLEDAILTRDSAAAQRAQKDKEKKLKEQDEQFALETQRRLEDEQLRRDEAAKEREEKIRDAEIALQDLIAKHAAERLERQADFNREIEQTRAKNATVAAQNQAAAQQVIATNRTLMDSAAATANSVSGSFRNMLNGLLSQIEGASGGRGGGKGSGKGMGGNRGSMWDFTGLEVSGSYSNAGGGKYPKFPNGNSAANNFGLGQGQNPFAKKELFSFETGGRVIGNGLVKADDQEIILNRDQQKGLGNSFDIRVTVPTSFQNADGMDVNRMVDLIEERVVEGVTRAVKGARPRGV